MHRGIDVSTEVLRCLKSPCAIAIISHQRFVVKMINVMIAEEIRRLCIQDVTEIDYFQTVFRQVIKKAICRGKSRRCVPPFNLKRKRCMESVCDSQKNE